MISIIIPVHNRADLLELTLTSIKRQLGIAYEIIVIDDNSSDIDIENITLQKGAIYLKNETNLGAQKSRNKGVMYSKYDYIAFLDSDDLWFDTSKLLKQYEVLTFHQDISIVYTSLEYIDANEQLISRQSTTPDIIHNNFIKTILKKDIIGTYSSVMIRKSDFINAGMCNTNLPARQDWDLWIRLSILGNAYKLGYCFTQYRIHENQISSAHEKKIDGFAQLLLNHKNLFKRHKIILTFHKHLLKLILLSTIQNSTSINYQNLMKQEFPFSALYIGIAKFVKFLLTLPIAGWPIKKLLASTYLFKGLQ